MFQSILWFIFTSLRDSRGGQITLLVKVHDNNYVAVVLVTAGAPEPPGWFQPSFTHIFGHGTQGPTQLVNYPALADGFPLQGPTLPKGGGLHRLSGWFPTPHIESYPHRSMGQRRALRTLASTEVPQDAHSVVTITKRVTTNWYLNEGAVHPLGKGSYAPLNSDKIKRNRVLSRGCWLRPGGSLREQLSLELWLWSRSSWPSIEFLRKSI